MRRIVVELTALTVALWFLFRVVAFLGLNFGWIGGLATLTVPASIAGELYGRRTGKEVSSRFAWQVAFAGGAILTLLLTVYFGIRLSGSGLYLLGPLLAITLIMFVLSFLSIRLVFRWGVTFGTRKTPQQIDPAVFD